MDITETRAMCLWLRKLIPHQAFDDDTPEVWQPILAGVEVADARTVVLGILERETYVTPKAIVGGVKRLRRDRLEHSGYVGITPNADPADAIAYNRERRALRDAIASGRMGEAEVQAYREGTHAALCGPNYLPREESLTTGSGSAAAALTAMRAGAAR